MWVTPPQHHRKQTLIPVVILVIIYYQSQHENDREEYICINQSFHVILVFCIGDGKCAHRCWEFCGSPCACKTAGAGNCEYFPMNGGCISRGTCSEMVFAANQCRRKNSFYSVAGVLCYHNKNEANCGSGVTLSGVNIAGEAHQDKRGISYTAGRDAIYEDDYITMKEDNTTLEDIKDVDNKLYGSYALGKGSGQKDFGQCLYYLVRVAEDGQYELALRTVEPKYRKPGQRV